MSESGTFRGTDLDLDGGWRLGEPAFALVLDALRAADARSVLEFGSGASSVRLALALPHARIHAIDHDPEWAAKTVELARAHGVQDRVQVDTRPLRWQWLAGAPYLTYAAGPIPGSVDALLIDGPPAWTLRGREACLHLAARSLRAGSLVVLDDCVRPDELRAIRNWTAAFPDALSGTLHADVGHGVWVGRVAAPLGRPRASVTRSADAWMAAVRRLRLRAREGLGRRAP